MKKGNIIDLQLCALAVNITFNELTSNPDDMEKFTAYEEAWEALLQYVRTHVSDGSKDYNALVYKATH